MGGRNREPVDLIITKGNYHITKEEVDKRREEELKFEAKDLKAPSFLSKSQRKLFKKYAKMLKQLSKDLFTDLDSDCLARYVVAEELYEKYSIEIGKLIESDSLDKWLLLADVEDEDMKELLEKILKRQKGDDLAVLLNQQDKLFKQLQSCARELGMSVTARGKIIIPQPPEEADEL